MADDPKSIEFKAETIQDGKPRSKTRITQADFSHIAEFIRDEWATRKRKRKDLEKQWAEIDRQVKMEPDVRHKKLPNGKIDSKKLWMSEVEPPFQAQALEVLTADARRMMTTDSGAPFIAHGEMTDEYLRDVELAEIILGDEAEVPSLMNQDNIDKLIQGFLMHQFRQYDLPERLDRVNAESFKYGMGVGRGRVETMEVYIHTRKGVMRETQKIPVLIPASIKNHYLDDAIPSIHTARPLAPAHIAEDHMKLEALQKAAAAGSSDPNDMDGGWMHAATRKLEPDDKGFVQLLEMEGDIVISRKTTDSILLPRAIVTVAVGAQGSDGKATTGVVRFRHGDKFPFSSYVLFPYHYEGADEVYPVSPLMKGRPVQVMIADAINRVLDSAALKNAPPVGYDRTDQAFANKGGPNIHPYAKWATADVEALRVFNEIGGDPGTLASIMSLGINLYGELTGVLPARLGAQTVSHTTAFAKDAELQRGAIRTVNYVRRTNMGPLGRWCQMSYQMGRDALKGRMGLFIDAYGGYVEIQKKHLPKRSNFEWFGSGGPAEEQQKMQARLTSLQFALQVDELAQAKGKPPKIDTDGAIEQILRDGKWTDLDAITRTDIASAGTQAAPVVPGTDQGNQASNTAPVALQAIAPEGQ